MEKRQRRGARPLSESHLQRLAQTRLAVELPEIEYPAELPVSQYRAQIEAALATNQVVIVAGETGSGKTTQIPKILLEMGRGRVGQIGHTQPRRIAARSVAERIAWELGTPLGEVVGYQVRFTDESSERTLVKVMTDGILLASLARDPKLLAYDTIIIDEAHERSLNIDFLLGYLARLLPFRPDLKLVITSSTIDSEKFASHFSPANLAKVAGAEPIVVSALPAKAPIIEVEGRTYPVEIRYRPLEETRNNKTIDKDIITGIVEACDELMNEGPGDILVFLSGEREIRDAATALTGHLGNLVTDPNIYGGVEIVPLFARLSAAEQHRVFSPGGKRRIILATNVAETSLTVPGIHYVVDTGLARISRYSKASKVQRLPIESISQASANQRSGRSGRITNGIAIRLYSEADFEQRSEFTEPEILRTSLASVILQMLAVGVVSKPDEIAQFPFVQAPDTKAIRDGVVLLRELGALATDNDDEGILTEIGRQLSTLPMDPRLARMVIAGVKNGVGNQVAVITAALSIQDPRERPEDFRDAADLLHNRFLFPSSDFLTLLNLWNYIREQQNELSSSAFRRLCKAEYLHYLRIREWQDLVSQIKAMAQDIGMRFDKPQLPFEVSKDSDIIHKSLLTGLLSNIGMQDTLEIKASAVAHLRGEKRALALRQAAKRARNEYRGARGIRFTIFPGSPVSKHPPHWIMASELVETSRLWARQVAKINPEWIESLAQHQVRRTYSDPHWSTKQGAALATEKVLLYGLPIVTNRKVQYGKIDAPAAREMFIRHALVYGEWHWRDKFYTHNQEFLSNLEKLAARSRQRQTSLSEEYLFEFYDSRLPESITSAGAFDYWWKKARISNPELLNLSQQDLATPELDHHDYPDFWHQGDLVLPLSYELSPGSDSDGVTVHLTASQLEVVEKGGFDWLVPGMLPELSIATVRALPKDLRVQLVPAPDTGKAVAQWLQAHKPPWVQITSAGNSGEPFAVAYSQALAAVRGIVVEPSIIAEATANLPTHLKMRFQTPDKAVELPELVATRPKPEVVAAASQVDLREELLQQLQLPTARITSRWTPKQALALAASPYATTEALVQDLQRAAIIEILSAATGNLTNLLGQPAATLANPSPELTATIKQDLEDTTYRIAADVAAGLAAGRELDVALRAANSLALLATASQIREQMSQLVFPGFIAATPAAQLRSLARYLTAATYRLEKAATSVARDQDLAHRISSFEKELGPENAAAAKWLLQELRVSYFAQHLGTSEAISEKRIRKSLQA